ncbi:hypothetical protein Y032_0011g1445 [Ancylostoma ceylanicum]|uniref:Histone acetyltransferase type B catalytic subunit n=3 Tax=Ancylostoma ceylanicum TaxID=53326 RepID=A0A016VEP4_9BILA|nr:hypothetical protein Y032_0011g1445 [Ancylostoma ceylanicum]
MRRANHHSFQMVRMEQDNILAASGSRFISDALEVVWIRFVSDLDSLNDSEGFHPEFAHQHFGDNETIYGYDDLAVNLYYSDASLFLYPELSYSTVVSSVEKDMKEDNVINKLKDQLPSDQMNMMVDSKEQFQVLLAKQKNFKPFGELITKFTAKEKCFELYKITESSPDFDNFLARVQSLALWYIDAAQYTDNTDPLWMHYFLFESKANDAGDGSRVYAFAGYASLYKFYAYPDRIRPRVAQIMLLPQFRKTGIGAKLLNAVYKDLCSMREVLDVTAEDPADNFVFLRDYVDCINCSKLPEFAPEKLKGGFTTEMRDAAQSKLKINKRQSRRVYEILRLRCTNMKNPDDAKAYRLDVKRRLEAPMRRNERDWKKIQRALDENEYAQVAASCVNEEQKMQQLQQLYEAEVEAYKITVERMAVHPDI